MTTRKFTGLLAAVVTTAGLLGVAGSASAEEVTWNLNVVHPDNLCATYGLCSSGGYDTATRSALDTVPGGYDAVRGNTLTYSSAGHGLTAAAFSAPGTGGATGVFETAVLGNYSGGLGVLNVNDGAHTVDNGGSTDMVIFYFDTDFADPVGATLTAFADTDTTWLVGGSEGDFKVGDNPFAGFVGRTFTDLASSADWVTGDTFNTTSPSFTGNDMGRYLIVAASTASAGYVDEFKIKLITSDLNEPPPPPPAEVPEPGTLVLAGLGLVALGVLRRRSRRLPA